MSEEKEAPSNAKHPIMDNLLAMTYRTVVACEEKEATDSQERRYSELFKHMINNHNCVLTETELDDICRVVYEMEDAHWARRVATLRLPVSVGAYAATTDALTKQYGPGLTVRQHGEFMIVEKPQTEGEA